MRDRTRLIAVRAPGVKGRGDGLAIGRVPALEEQANGERKRERKLGLCELNSDRRLDQSVGGVTGLKPRWTMIPWSYGDRIVIASNEAAGCAPFRTANPYLP